MAKMGDTTITSALQPEWFADYGDRVHLLPAAGRLDASLFNAEDAVVVNVGAAGALAGATSVPVDALSGPIPAGTLLWFSGTKFARLTAAAAAAATSLTVSALPAALVDADVTTYAGVGKKRVPRGTFVGRTFAERDAGALFGPAADTDDEQYLTWNDVTDLAVSNYVTFVSPGARIKENKLPGWAGLSAGLKADIRAKYVTIRGAE